MPDTQYVVLVKILSYLLVKANTVSAEYKYTAPWSYDYLVRLMVSCDGLRIGWPLHKYDGLRLFIIL